MRVPRLSPTLPNAPAIQRESKSSQGGIVLLFGVSIACLAPGSLPLSPTTKPNDGELRPAPCWSKKVLCIYSGYEARTLFTHMQHGYKHAPSSSPLVSGQCMVFELSPGDDTS